MRCASGTYAGALRTFVAGCAFVFLALAGCAPTQQPLADEPDSLLVEVLTDLYLLEGRVRFDASRSTVTNLPGRDSLLATHGFTEASFTQQLALYRDHPEAFYTLQKEVLERLNLERLDLSSYD